MHFKIKKIFFSKKFPIILSLIVGTGLIALVFIYNLNNVYGYVTTESGMRVFGGKVTDVTICCNGLKLKVGDKDTFLLTATSDVRMWYNPTKGQCVIGDSYPGGVCLKPKDFCFPTGGITDGTIRMIGTTLTGPPSGTCGGSSVSNSF